uniref:TRAF family member-associated NFKB activator n=1 Tax=Gasterosteus aculeatus aculeatus TaxID=481459 RepID=A0AAQ4R328_GASAC
MEEAYNELYQEFLGLRSLCLRQAALLHKLTAALQKQQGARVPNGQLNLLAEDMSKLGVGVPRHGEEDGTLEQMVAPLLSWDFTRWPGASSSVTNHPGQAVDHSRHKTKHTFGIPARDSPSLPRDLLDPSDGLMMSDIVLQSNVCEFCQAVFPGDTTTRGEFLRHLCTHVT